MSWSTKNPSPGLPLLADAPPGAALRDWVFANRAELSSALTRAGAVLIRDSGLTSGEDFAAVWRAFDEQPRAYVEGQSQREKVTGTVYTSTAYPPAEVVTLHQELSYVHDPPRFLGLFCEIAPEVGGASPVADGRQLLAALPEATRRAFEGRSIRYLKTMHGGGGGRFRFGKSWQEHFETDDRAAVEAYLARGGVRWRWLDDGALRTEQVRPAILPHPVTGELVWYNQAALWHVSNLGERGGQLLELLGMERLPTHATFEDGEPIDAQWMDDVRRVGLEIALRFPWRAGDVLFVDNVTMLHGRDPFRGRRRVLVTMGDGPRA